MHILFFLSMPRVSVIIPTYNRRQILPRAVESVFEQTYKDYELIIADDGSSDDTPELTDTYPEARWIRLDENSGVAKARNSAVDASSGDWIAFLDSDDWWHPQKLQYQMDYCVQNPRFKIIQTNEIWIRNGKRVNPPLSHIKKEGDIFPQSVERCMITPSSVILKRSLWDKSGGFEESFPACEDYDLWLRITCSHEVGLEPRQLLIRYGGHCDQLSSTIPCLDKYRILSLQNLLNSKLLNTEQTTMVRNNLKKRASIMATGSLKRGKKKDYEHYISLT
ncbi:MAG: glycosyltransferase family 2 protein [Chitinispirillaceae bacterium]